MEGSGYCRLASEHRLHFRRKPGAAQALKDKIEDKASRLMEHPRMHRAGRVNGTREMVAHPNYVVIYSDDADTVTILRVLHTAQQWP